MTLTRRDAMQVSLTALLCLSAPVRAQQLVAVSASATLEELVAAFAGEGPIENEGVALTLPAVAEDGYRVSVSIDAPGAEEVLLIAPGNPVLPVLNAKFGSLAGAQTISTRMRLGQTQDVLALARMPDGNVRRDQQPVSVVIGGCA